MITPAANPFLLIAQAAAVVAVIGATWTAIVLPVVEIAHRREQSRRAAELAALRNRKQATK